MSILADIILVAILIAAFVYWRNKGLVKSVWKIAALIITIVLVLLLKNPATDFISHTKLAENLNNSISGMITIPPGGGVNITERLNLPEFMQTGIDIGAESGKNAAEAINNAAALTLTDTIIAIGVCISLFILIRLALTAAFLVVNTCTKLPVIRGANKLLGGILGMINVVFIIFLALALFTIFAPSDNNLYNIIDKSHLVKYFYNNNILLRLFMQ